MQIFSMRLKAPLMNLVGSRIDGVPQTLPIPARSMITGLIGAALGIGRDEPKQLQAIQDTLEIAVVVHRTAGTIVDYQTADLSKPYLTGPMWSSGSSVMEREGIAIKGTRIQHRPLVADAHMTVLVRLDDGAPHRGETILAALDEPARPLGIGRMSCPPAARIAGSVLEASDLEEAVGLVEGGNVYLPVSEVTPRWDDLLVSIPGRCDWNTRHHGGVDGYVLRARDAEHEAT